MTKFTSQFYTENNEETYVGYLKEDGNERFLAAVTVNGEKAALWLFNSSEDFINPKQIMTDADAQKHLYGFGMFGDTVSCLDQPVMLHKALRRADFNSRKTVVSGNEVVGIRMAWENMELNLERVPCSLCSVFKYDREKENDEKYTSLPADIRSKIRQIDLDMRQLHDYMELFMGRYLTRRLERLRTEENVSRGYITKEQAINHLSHFDITTNVEPYHFDMKPSEIRRVIFEICGYPCLHCTDEGAQILDQETLGLLETRTDDKVPDFKMGKLLHTGVTVLDYLLADNAVRNSLTLFDGRRLNNKSYPLAALVNDYYDLKKKRKELLKGEQHD